MRLLLKPVWVAAIPRESRLLTYNGWTEIGKSSATSVSAKSDDKATAIEARVKSLMLMQPQREHNLNKFD